MFSALAYAAASSSGVYVAVWVCMISASCRVSLLAALGAEVGRFCPHVGHSLYSLAHVWNGLVVLQGPLCRPPSL